MIIPTAEYDPLFADDGVDFREKMIQYIDREFADLLGSRRQLLFTPGGLDTLATLLSGAVQQTARNAA